MDPNTDREMLIDIEGNAILVSGVLLTPADATELLALNHNNRRVRGAYVRGLAETLRQGEFTFNGATIVISDEGHLLDGQHRLKAIESSGVPAWTLVVRGVSSAAMPTIDQGTPRTAADILNWLDADTKNAKQMAAVARVVMLLQGNPEFTRRESVAAFAHENSEPLAWAATLGVSLSNAARKTSFLTLRQGSRMGGKSAVAAAMLGTLCFYLDSSGARREHVETFLRRVIENIADEHTPKLIQAVRRRWAGDSPFNTASNNSREIATDLDVAVNAFNAWMQMTDMTKLQVRRDGHAPADWFEVRPAVVHTRRTF